MKKYKKIAYFTPIPFRDVGNIVEYFINNSEEFFLYLYPPSYHNKPTIFQHYKNKKKLTTETVWPYKGNNKIIIHLFYYIFYIYFLLKYRISHTYIISHFPIFLFLNSLISFLTFNRFVFWIWDYFPSNKGVTKTYNNIVMHYNDRLNYVIYLSPALEKIYKHLNKDKIRQTVSLGIKDIKVSRRPIKNLLGYVGNLRPGQGIEFLLEIVKTNKQFSAQIIGDGPLKNTLENFVKENSLTKRVEFFGFVENEKMKNIVSKWEVAVAAYTPGKNVPANYADLGKLKLYVQYELPIIMTKVSYFYKELIKYHAGLAINLSYQEFNKAHKKIQRNYNEYCSGVKKLKKENQYGDYYDKKFNFLKNYE